MTEKYKVLIFIESRSSLNSRGYNIPLYNQKLSKSLKGGFILWDASGLRLQISPKFEMQNIESENFQYWGTGIFYRKNSFTIIYNIQIWTSFSTGRCSWVQRNVLMQRLFLRQKLIYIIKIENCRFLGYNFCK